MRTIVVLAAVATIGCAAVGVLYSSNPLRRNPVLIREKFLLDKPIGTPISEIEHWLAGEKKLRYEKINAGFRKSYPPPPAVIGVQSIEANLGEYRTIFVTSVVAYWGFDERGKLVDVWVRKTTDAL